jgi:hypothetical protein
MLRNKFVLPLKSWFFTSFHFFFLLMVLHDVTFNVTTTIYMWSFWFFSRNFTRSIVLKLWIKTLVNKKNSSSFIITKLELRFEPCVLTLTWKWGAKDPKKKRRRTNYHKFRSEETSKKIRNIQKRKPWCLNVIISCNEEL